MDVFVYKKAVEEICKENIRSIRPGIFIINSRFELVVCSDDCILKKHGLCSGYPVTDDSIVNVVDKIDDKSVKIVNDWLHNEQN